MIAAGTVTPRVAWVWGLVYLAFRIMFGLAYSRGSVYRKYLIGIVIQLNVAIAWYAMGAMISVFVRQRSGDYLREW